MRVILVELYNDCNNKLQISPFPGDRGNGGLLQWMWFQPSICLRHATTFWDFHDQKPDVTSSNKHHVANERGIE